MKNVLHHTCTRSRTRRRSLPLVAMLALGSIGIGASTATAAAPAAPAMPFLAAVAGTVTDTGPGATGLPTFSLAGSGVANQLGPISYTGKVVVTSIDSNGVIRDTLTETLTAAHGDSLTLLCQQVATPIAPGSSVLHGIDQWTVIGGTGHFSNATGSGTGDTFVQNFQTFLKSFAGRVTK